jgi:hypothetical protein
MNRMILQSALGGLISAPSGVVFLDYILHGTNGTVGIIDARMLIVSGFWVIIGAVLILTSEKYGTPT